MYTMLDLLFPRSWGGPWTDAAPPLYPILSVGAAGLREESVVLLDQIRAAQASRIESYIGSLTETEYEPIRKGITKMFGI